MNKPKKYEIVYYYANKEGNGIGRATATAKNGTIYTVKDIAETERAICKENDYINAVIINIIPLESEGEDTNVPTNERTCRNCKNLSDIGGACRHCVTSTDPFTGKLNPPSHWQPKESEGENEPSL